MATDWAAKLTQSAPQADAILDRIASNAVGCELRRVTPRDPSEESYRALTIQFKHDHFNLYDDLDIVIDDLRDILKSKGITPSEKYAEAQDRSGQYALRTFRYYDLDKTSTETLKSFVDDMNNRIMTQQGFGIG